MITLKTLPEATAQQVFDQVAAHLLKQNKTSETGPYCAYRSEDGLKCAAGCLIGEDEYDEDAMEGQNWLALTAKDLAPHHHEGLIHALQFIHDNKDPEEWRASLRRYADVHKLDSAVLEQFDDFS